MGLHQVATLALLVTTLCVGPSTQAPQLYITDPYADPYADPYSTQRPPTTTPQIAFAVVEVPEKCGQGQILGEDNKCRTIVIVTQAPTDIRAFLESLNG